jgi:hypothetical protein
MPAHLADLPLVERKIAIRADHLRKRTDELRQGIESRGQPLARGFTGDAHDLGRGYGRPDDERD